MIGSIKRYLGIEGVDVTLNVPEQINASVTQSIDGQVTLNAKSDNDVLEIKLTLIERYQRGRRKSKLIDEYILGQTIYKEKINILKDQQKLLNFSLPFRLQKSDMDKFGDKNFIFKGVSTAAKLLKGAKSSFRVECQVKVKGTKLNPFVVKDIVIE